MGLASILAMFVFSFSLFSAPEPRPAAPSGQGTGPIISRSVSLGFIGPITKLVSSLTAVNALIGSASTIILGWRADRRQSAEFKLKMEQLEVQLADARQKKSAQM